VHVEQLPEVIHVAHVLSQVEHFNPFA